MIEKIKYNFSNNKSSIFYRQIVILLIFISAIYLRLYNLNYQDYWQDELNTFWHASPDINLLETHLRILSRRIGSEFDFDYGENANFFIYIYKFVFQIFGYTPEIGRATTATIGVAVVFVSILIYKKFFSRQLVLFSILISFNYYLIIQSQEYRYNIFFCLISLINIYFYFFLIGKDSNGKSLKYSKSLYFISSFLCIWTHVFGFLIIFTQIAFLFLKRKDILSKNILNYLLIITFYFLINYQQIANLLSIKHFWITLPSGDFYYDYYFKYFFGSRISGRIYLAVLIFIIFFNIKKIFNYKDELSFLLLLLFNTYFIPIIYSLIFLPVLEVRYIIYIVPVILILLAYLVELIDKDFLKYLLLTLLIFITVSNTTYSLFILKKNDKPHISKILDVIAKKEEGSITNIVSHNPYLNNYLKRKEKFKQYDFNMIPYNSIKQKNDIAFWFLSLSIGQTRYAVNFSENDKFLVIDKLSMKYVDAIKIKIK